MNIKCGGDIVSTKICSKCKTENNENHNYCFACGYPLNESIKEKEIIRLLGISFGLEVYNMLDKLVNVYESILYERPNYADVRYRCALAYEIKGDYQKAIYHLTEALKINPDYIQARSKLADIYVILGNYQEALIEYKNLLNTKIKYTFADVHNNIGVIYEKQGDIKQAKAYYQKAISLNPKFAKPYYNLGNIYYEKGDYEQAIAYYKKALSLKLEIPEVYNNLALAYYKLDNLIETENNFLNAIKLDPFFFDAYYNIILFYIQNNNFHNARKYLDILKQRYPKNFEIDYLEKNLDKKMKESIKNETIEEKGKKI